MSTAIEVSPGWLTALREAGKAGFTGLPTQRQEAWKYTGLNKLKALTFEPSPTAAGLPAKVSDDGAVASAHRLVFVDAVVGDAERLAFVIHLADFVVKMEGQRPACVLEQRLTQLDHFFLHAVSLFDLPVINPPGEPGRLRPIDPLLLPSQTDQPLDEDVLGWIARLKAELPRFQFVFVLPEHLSRQDHEIRAAAVIEGVEP